MQTMADHFNLPVGYSDHTEGDIACIVSIGLGAKIIEKHFTLDKTMEGPDQSTSATPDEFIKLVKSIRLAERALGSAVKKPCAAEQENMVGMRRSIVAKHNLIKGEVIGRDSITFKRPATGIKPNYFTKLLGKKIVRDVKVDEMIQWDDIDL
jgi:sialic acid synthase SpsE